MRTVETVLCVGDRAALDNATLQDQDRIHKAIIHEVQGLIANRVTTFLSDRGKLSLAIADQVEHCHHVTHLTSVVDLTTKCIAPETLRAPAGSAMSQLIHAVQQVRDGQEKHETQKLTMTNAIDSTAEDKQDIFIVNGVAESLIARNGQNALSKIFVVAAFVLRPQTERNYGGKLILTRDFNGILADDAALEQSLQQAGFAMGATKRIDTDNGAALLNVCPFMHGI